MAKPGPKLKYKNAEELQKKIDAYFKRCKKSGEHLTVTGLALACDMTRQQLIEYADRSEEFSDAIKMAKMQVESYIEQRLFGPNATGCIFNLKNNFGWKDKTETEILAHVKDISSEPIEEDSDKWLKKAKDTVGLHNAGRNTH